LIVESNWKELSQLTKSRDYKGNFHKDRYVHSRGWKNKIEGLLANTNIDKVM